MPISIALHHITLHHFTLHYIKLHAGQRGTEQESMRRWYTCTSMQNLIVWIIHATLTTSERAKNLPEAEPSYPWPGHPESWLRLLAPAPAPEKCYSACKKGKSLMH